MLLKRPHPDWPCDAPSAYKYPVDASWRCPVCGQRWRLILTPVSCKRVWVKIGFFEWVKGR